MRNNNGKYTILETVGLIVCFIIFAFVCDFFTPRCRYLFCDEQVEKRGEYCYTHKHEIDYAKSHPCYYPNCSKARINTIYCKFHSEIMNYDKYHGNNSSSSQINTTGSSSTHKNNHGNKMPDCDDYDNYEDFMDDWDGYMPDGSDAEDYWEDW